MPLKMPNAIANTMSRPVARSCTRPSFHFVLFKFLSLFVLLFAISPFTTASAANAPYSPADDKAVLERLPGSGDAARRDLRALRMKLSENSKDLALATKIARGYIGLGRAEADPRYDGYAESALAPWIYSSNPPIEVLVLRAVMRQRRHDFDGANADFDRVLELRPGQPQALLSRAFVLLVQGELEAARKSCARLPASINALIRAACSSRVDASNGNAHRAYEYLDQALQANPKAATKLRLWAMTILAETAQSMGRDGPAEQQFREALALDLRDVYLLGAYADFLLDRNRADEARRLLQGETRADGLLLRRALAEYRLGHPEAEALITTLRARFAASRRRGDARHIREEARFTLHLLNQPAAALRLALQNWQTQRETWDARLVLETALAANAHESAKGVIAWIEATGIEDATLRGLTKRLKRGDV